MAIMCGKPADHHDRGKCLYKKPMHDDVAQDPFALPPHKLWSMTIDDAKACRNGVNHCKQVFNAVPHAQRRWFGEAMYLTAAAVFWPRLRLDVAPSLIQV